ncbi:alpha/beta fold hydrolase [Streptomyces sp. NPDC004290]
MSDKPAIVLVHGFWGGAAHWANVVVELDRRGYDRIHAVENPLTSLADDAERTRKMLRQIDGPVVLVGHSYGGAVITEAGDLPHVTALVYIAAFAPDAGESPGGITEEKPPAAVANIAPTPTDISGSRRTSSTRASPRISRPRRRSSWPSPRRPRSPRRSATPSARRPGGTSRSGTRCPPRTA